MKGDTLLKLAEPIVEPIWKGVAREAAEAAARRFGEAVGEAAGSYFKALVGLGLEDDELDEDIEEEL